MTQFFLAAASDEYALIKWAGTIDWLTLRPKAKSGIDSDGNHWKLAVLRHPKDCEQLAGSVFSGYIDLGVDAAFLPFIASRLRRETKTK